MNVILLTAIIFTVALVPGGQGLQPCEERSSNNAYGAFVRRHILRTTFNRNSKQAWQRYLVTSRLCGRTRVQSFIDADENQVRQICSSAGRRVQGATGNKGNLCISTSPMQIYDVVSVNSMNGCIVRRVTPRTQKVIVACNKVANFCRPVHYEKYRNQSPDNVACM